MERKLSDIFADNPANLTDDELREIVNALRAQRGRWAEAQTTRRAGTKKAAKVRPEGKLSLDDLEL